MQTTENVIIKGVREGLLFILDDDVPFAEILQELVQRINSQPHFFKGAGVVLNAGRRVLETSDFDRLYRLLSRNDMKVLSFVSMSAQSRMVAESFGVTSRPPSFAAGDSGASLGLQSRGTRPGLGGTLAQSAADGGVVDAGTGLFLRATLRHGQTVRYPGDVCILGDVEPGAEVIADGDVVVWGTLRGLVHAGSNGDDEAVVCALQMSPVQLSIAGVVSRFPSHATRYPDSPQPPELARLEGGRIVIEGWQGTVAE
ncbi:MAG: septum site-determining protein MinC [Chloroflexota bacterium]|nr:septum site-determining protein MinC [Chloroflexota bacterium]